MNGGDLVDRGVIWLYTVEGVLMFQSNKLYLKLIPSPILHICHSCTC